MREKTLGKKHHYIADSLNNLASVYEFQGQYEKAERFLLNAIEIYENIFGNNYPNLATSLNNIGLLYAKLNRYEEAEKSLNRAITIYEIAFGKHHPSVARSINNLAFIYRNQGKFEKALSYYNKALNRLSFSSEIDMYNLPNITETAIILQNRQFILNKLAENDSSFAREAFNHSINTVAFLEQLRTGIDSQKSKIQLWVEQSSSFELALQSYLLIQPKGAIAKDEAYIFLEYALSRTLSEQLLNRFKIIGKDIKTEILQKEQAFLKRQNLLEKSIIKANDKTQRKKIKEAYLKNKNELRNFIDYLHQEYTDYARLKYPRPVSLEVVQNKLLSPNKIALSYYLGNNQSFLLIVTDSKIDLRPLNISKKDVEKEISNLRKALLWYEENEDNCKVSVKSIKRIKEDSNEIKIISQELYKQLILPAASYLKETEEIVVIPHLSLWTLPFEVLSNADAIPLGIQYRISYQNSFSVWFFSQTFLKRKLSNPKTFIGFGDAIYENDKRFKSPNFLQLAKKAYLKSAQINSVNLDSKDNNIQSMRLRSKSVKDNLKSCSFNSLELSKTEINEIMSLSIFKDKADSRFGVFASEWNLGDLEQYKYVHFSVHGSMRMKLQGKIIQPALVLTQKNPPETNVDGILTLEEVMNNLKLNADLVVLSACETGIGEVLGSEGILAMTRAFQYAGSAAVLSSLWKVHEDATKLFMVRFYSYLDEGEKPSNALYFTKKDFQGKNIKHKNPLIDLSHPFFWGAFVLVGG